MVSPSSLRYHAIVPVSDTMAAKTLDSSVGTSAYRLCETLEGAGYEAWFVGGAVRDMLLGNVPDDIDIATSATPADVMRLNPKSNADHTHLGVTFVSVGGHAFEVATFRQDTDASDGRHPESVSYTTREIDAKRRDITINALYWRPLSRELYDPYDGERDLSERLIRIIGDPKPRMEHDALRLMRVIRFRALINGQYHPDTYNALRECAGLIDSLSGPRRFEELMKILVGPAPERALEDMWETDVLEYVLPELHACKGVAQPADYHKEGDVWDHTLKCLAACNHDHGPDVRLAALFHDCGKAVTFERSDRIRFDEHASVSASLAAEALKRLRCPSKRIEKITWLVEHHMMMGSFEDMNDTRKAHWYYHPWFVELLQLFHIDIAGTEPSNYDLYDSIIADYNAFLDSHPLPPKPLVSGDDVMERSGLQPGPRVGEILKKLYDAQIKGDISGKSEALAYLDQLSVEPSD